MQDLEHITQEFDRFLKDRFFHVWEQKQELDQQYAEEIEKYESSFLRKRLFSPPKNHAPSLYAIALYDKQVTRAYNNVHYEHTKASGILPVSIMLRYYFQGDMLTEILPEPLDNTYDLRRLDTKEFWDGYNPLEPQIREVLHFGRN